MSHAFPSVASEQLRLFTLYQIFYYLENPRKGFSQVNSFSCSHYTTFFPYLENPQRGFSQVNSFSCYM